jgi:hypothetical protein
LLLLGRSTKGEAFDLDGCPPVVVDLEIEAFSMSAA